MVVSAKAADFVADLTLVLADIRSAGKGSCGRSSRNLPRKGARRGGVGLGQCDVTFDCQTALTRSPQIPLSSVSGTLLKQTPKGAEPFTLIVGSGLPFHPVLLLGSENSKRSAQDAIISAVSIGGATLA